MDKWGKLVEERLQAAFTAGQFADLPGRGKPLALDDEPLADPAHWMARRILRNSGMSLPWVEERRRIEEALAQSRKRLRRSWSAYAAHRGNGPASTANEPRWQRVLAAFEEEIAALNRRIRVYNLAVPHVRFQLCPIEVGREISRLRRGSASLR